MDNATRRREAVFFFFPNGMWDGYDKFFGPALPARLGEAMLLLIHEGFEHNDTSKLMQAAVMLSKTHKKNHHSKGKPQVITPCICEPTGMAAKAIDHLLDSVYEINDNRPQVQEAIVREKQTRGVTDESAVGIVKDYIEFQSVNARTILTEILNQVEITTRQ